MRGSKLFVVTALSLVVGVLAPVAPVSAAPAETPLPAEEQPATPAAAWTCALGWATPVTVPPNSYTAGHGFFPAATVTLPGLCAWSSGGKFILHSQPPGAPSVSCAKYNPNAPIEVDRPTVQLEYKAKHKRIVVIATCNVYFRLSNGTREWAYAIKIRAAAKHQRGNPALVRTYWTTVCTTRTSCYGWRPVGR